MSVRRAGDVPAFYLLEVRAHGVVGSYSPPLPTKRVRGAALGCSVGRLHSTGGVVLSLLLSSIVSVLSCCDRQGLYVTLTKFILKLHRSIIDIGTLDVEVLAQIDLRNGDHVVGTTLVVVPGASFGVLCQVEFEIVLYYLAKSFGLFGVHVALGALKRFGMESLVDIVSAVGVLGCTIRGLCGLAWAQLGKRSQFPAVVFVLLEVRELVEVLFFLSLSNHASLEKLRSSW